MLIYLVSVLRKCSYLFVFMILLFKVFFHIICLVIFFPFPQCFSGLLRFPCPLNFEFFLLITAGKRELVFFNEMTWCQLYSREGPLRVYQHKMDSMFCLVFWNMGWVFILAYKDIIVHGIYFNLHIWCQMYIRYLY